MWQSISTGKHGIKTRSEQVKQRKLNSTTLHISADNCMRPWEKVMGMVKLQAKAKQKDMVFLDWVRELDLARQKDTVHLDGGKDLGMARPKVMVL